MSGNKINRGIASEFYVAAELRRRNFVDSPTLGNTPNTDILCSNVGGTKFVHIQVKTFVPGNKTVTLGQKAEINFGDNFIWVLSGIPHPRVNDFSDFVFFVIPSPDLSKNVSESHREWLKKPGKNGRPHKDTNMRNIGIPPQTAFNGWSIAGYKNRWDIVENLLAD